LTKNILGGSGYLQNQNEIGHGYEDGVTVNYPKKTQMLIIVAPMVRFGLLDKNYARDF
jgi:hypothetical protein